MLTINRTYEILTEESIANGDFEECGFIAQGEQVTFKELVEMMQGCEASCSPIKYADERTWVTCYGDMDFITGDYRNESIHFADKPSKVKYWLKALNVVFNNNQRRINQ